MRWTGLVIALSLAGCGAQGQISDNADEALAEAERANGRISDLEAQVAELESTIQQESSDREDSVRMETVNREAETSRIDSDVADLEARIPY